MSESPAPIVDEFVVPTRSASVFTVEVDGEAVLLDEHANRLHLLNHTATLAWLLFDGITPLHELGREIAGELGIPSPAVVADLLTIVQDLAAEGLLEGLSPSRPRTS